MAPAAGSVYITKYQSKDSPSTGKIILQQTVNPIFHLQSYYTLHINVMYKSGNAKEVLRKKNTLTNNQIGSNLPSFGTIHVAFCLRTEVLEASLQQHC